MTIVSRPVQGLSTGAWGTQLDAYLDQFAFSPANYGAAGDGIVDDSAAINAASSASSAAGNGVVCLPSGTYKTSSALSLPAGTILCGVGPTSIIKPTSSTNGSRQLSALGTLSSAFTLTADVAEGAVSFTLSAGQGANFAAGDILQLADSATGTATQLVRVASVVTDTITIAENTYNAFAAATTTVKKVSAVSGIQVRNLTFDFANVTGTNTRGLSFFYADRPVIANCIFKNSALNASAGSPTVGGAALDLSGAFEPQVSNLRFDMCGCTGVDALYIDTCFGGQFDNIILQHGGFHINLVRSCANQFNNVRSTFAGWQTNGGRAFKLTNSTSYNALSNIHLSQAHSNGLGFVLNCRRNTVNGLVSTGHLTAEGIWFNGQGSTDNVITGYVGRFNATWDIGSYAGTDARNYVEGDFDPAKVLMGNNTSRFVSRTNGAYPSVASTAALFNTNPIQQSDLIQVTGTTGITSMVASWPGRVITLVFAGILTVTDGVNLKLNGNFVTTADDTLTLVCDGTNWIEIARSAN